MLSQRCLLHIQESVLSRQSDIEFDQERYFGTPWHVFKMVKLNEITKHSEYIREVLGWSLRSSFLWLPLLLVIYPQIRKILAPLLPPASCGSCLTGNCGRQNNGSPKISMS